MTKLAFHIVDVFAEKKYAGNQLAVFRRAGALSGDEMQQIAREINFSETTFILSDEQRNGGFDVRIFTPREEIPFAGHPTLGTAHVTRKDILSENAEEAVLNVIVGSSASKRTNSGDTVVNCDGYVCYLRTIAIN